MHTDLGHNPDATAEQLLRAREGFDVKKHLQDTKDAPRVSGDPTPQAIHDPQFHGPNAGSIPPRRADALPRNIGMGAGAPPINLEELMANLRKVGLEIVPVGDKPSTGYALNQEEVVKDLQAQVAALHDRAVSAEAAAAESIRELNDLKEAQKKKP